MAHGPAAAQWAVAASSSLTTLEHHADTDPVQLLPTQVEPPLPDLKDRGFLTPASLHYVRNHGATRARAQQLRRHD